MNSKIQSIQKLINQLEIFQMAFHARMIKKGRKIIPNLTIYQMNFYFLLVQEKSLKMSEVATHLGIKPSGATQLVDNLIAHDLIVRKYNPLDRRTILIELSDEGQKTAKKIKEERDKILCEMYDTLEEKELNQLCELLAKVRL
jgi:DNA-binding MarR family transcriptional regulator